MKVVKLYLLRSLNWIIHTVEHCSRTVHRVERKLEMMYLKMISESSPEYEFVKTKVAKEQYTGTLWGSHMMVSRIC